MELWIRSQDKTKLIKAENIMIIEDVIEGITMVDASGETIQPPIKREIMIIASDTVVGTYKTKERAIEVLDEIQNIIHNEFIFENLTYEKADLILKGKIFENMVKFYEMPEK